MVRTSILVCVILLLSASGHTECPSADLSDDCYVGLADLAVMASEWENEPNVAEFSVMASQWRTEGVPDDPQNLVWVSINEPGVFTGEMSRYETTNAQYCQFLNSALDDGLITVDSSSVYATSDPCNLEPYFDTYAADSDSQIDYSVGTFSVRSRDGHSMATHPVVIVSWYGATAFCDYYGYRLPTEWEWKAAADHHGEFIYGCGGSIDPSKANYYLGDGIYCNPLGLSSYPYTSPVNHYSSYGYGMNDMAGNVSEWTSSLYDPGYIYRVYRGGNWYNNSQSCRVSSRLNYNPKNTDRRIGFRVCR